MIMMIVSVYGNRFATKNQRKISAFNGHIISNYDNQSEVTLVPISKTGLLSQV
jgi:hypothetical protein